MIKDYTHLVLTQFNVHHPGWENRTPNNFWMGRLKEAWLENRFEIFDNVCYPSLVSQTNQNFRWLVLFDKKTPKKWNKKIESYDKITPIFCDWKDRYEEIIAYAKSEFLITTRIDNDDAFGRTAIEEIQKQFKRQPRMYVNLDNGVVTDGESILKSSSEPSNPFVSLISGQPFEIIWSIKHGDARYSGNIINIATKPIWLRYVHKRNVNNKIFVYAPDADKNVLENFEVNLPIKGT